MKRLCLTLLILTLLVVPSVSASPAAAPAAPMSNDIRISQVYGGGGNSGATYKNDFIELFNSGTTSVSLAGWSVQYASASGSTWQVTNLSGSIAHGGYYLVQEAQGAGGTTNLPAPDATGSISMSGTNGKVALVSSTTALSGSCPTIGVMDFVGYGTANCFEGSAATPALSNTTAALRNSSGCTDTDQNAADFTTPAPAPRNNATATYACPVNAPIQLTCPSAIITRDGRAASGPVSATDSDGTVTGAVITSGGTTGITLDNVPPAGAEGGTLNAMLNVSAATIVGVYNVLLTFTNGDAPTPQTATCTVPVTVGDGVCPATAVTDISVIQGSGATSPIAGSNATILGQVVGDFQGNTMLDGFYVQDGGDGDQATSDGIFVYAPGAVDVVVGDAVQVSGKVAEYYDVTELTTVTGVSFCGNPPAITPTPISLPETVNGELERYEGMLVTFPQTLTADQNYFQGRYGQITLSSDGRMFNPTNGNGLGDTVELDARRMIVLDDGATSQNPAPIPYIGADNTHRAGDTVTGLTGVLDYGPINSTPPYIYDYRIQPTAAVVFTRANPRTAAPDPVGGNVKVAGANVLNYFTTIDPNSGAAGYSCGPAHDQECRGADSAAELTRQRTKILAELQAINADVFGLMEIESTDDVAVADLAQGLNDALGAGTYNYVVEPAPGADAIKVAMLYKPGVVTPVGPAINYQTSDPTYGAELFDRPPLAQTFSLNANGEMLTVVVNHFKSKSSCPTTPGDPDLDYGQGCWNAKRVAQAQAMLGFVATLQQTDPDVLVIGDLNAYGREDPINTLVGGGLTNELAAHVPAATRYTYVFDGLSGYLDQALATRTMDLQVAGVTIWHNNTDEPSVIDYNLEFKLQDLYTPTAYRATDHDPVVIGVNLVPVIDLSVAGNVFLDANGDGWRQANEQPGVAGIRMTLQQGSNVVGQVLSVAEDGWYQFINVPAGDYCVSAEIPARYVPTSPTQVCVTKATSLPAIANFGVKLAPKASIGDRVWYDDNGNGVQDAGEVGIGNVTVDLLTAVGGAPGAVIATATTGADGDYQFGNLAGGSYFVKVTDQNGILAGLKLTSGPQSKPNPFGPITVNCGDVYGDADFGYTFVVAPGHGLIGDRVWLDANHNGIQNAGEGGLAGVEVCASPLGYTALVCATTNADGVYRLSVPKGVYLVAVTRSPAGLAPTTAEFFLPVVVSSGGQTLTADFGYAAQ
ncbi:MAG: ExeM/NucH family extracellular endonuclease [Chloroflexi bacterium]|nr:ExeM/NucH family extracellular endonuclease [Chloroflexota bacterium]